jgi:hypothetical protein
VQLSTSELATAELRQARQRIEQDDTDGRRLDWLDAHLAEIQKDIGLDPNNVWIFEKEELSDND